MRPKITIPLTKIDLILEAFSLLGIFFSIGMVLNEWNSIPDIIPVHFNASGEVDGYGSKSILFIMIPVMLVLYLLLTIVNKFPHLFNFLVEITPENAEIQYTYATKLIRILKLELIIVFSYINLSMIRSTLAGSVNLWFLFLPVTLIAIFGTIGYYFYKSLSAK